MDLRGKGWELLIQSLQKYGGDTVKQVILWHLEHVFYINQSNYLDNPEKLVSALYSIYGNAFMIIEKDFCYSLKEIGIMCDTGILSALMSLKHKL